MRAQQMTALAAARDLKQMQQLTEIQQQQLLEAQWSLQEQEAQSPVRSSAETSQPTESDYQGLVDLDRLAVEDKLGFT